MTAVSFFWIGAHSPVIETRNVWFLCSAPYTPTLRASDSLLAYNLKLHARLKKNLIQSVFQAEKSNILDHLALCALEKFWIYLRVVNVKELQKIYPNLQLTRADLWKSTITTGHF